MPIAAWPRGERMGAPAAAPAGRQCAKPSVRRQPARGGRQSGDRARQSDGRARQSEGRRPGTPAWGPTAGPVTEHSEAREARRSPVRYFTGRWYAARYRSAGMTTSAVSTGCPEAK
ncbi:hypothetical protein SHKM778_13900 [Streptomyces sp. KM77-8]|uniref:Uncharacterized protein n=1 Tax=Streptomyces haneummycinicus TaxID=3074435 RepID=A0AAT9HC72_9ACTN